ncbi:hypothetical protein [Natronoglycomyces albus]|uniref:Uncharacterized protein n=1 Tax=Natronoglycomyces albus TaxID=2811108 RepID=A0A895XKE1_9ACTN|nr:hypothetical protein [Natronoglycomyces albus]QSB05517.1 hypothetical protein JQS30_00815 [Natronoglycomyces albus]
MPETPENSHRPNDPEWDEELLTGFTHIGCRGRSLRGFFAVTIVGSLIACYLSMPLGHMEPSFTTG